MVMSVVSPMVAKRVGSEAPGTRHLLLLHGIYGRGRNWLAVARMLVERRPDWACWLADMRHHGDAHPGPECGTLDALAGDIATWSWGIPSAARWPWPTPRARPGVPCRPG
jgi:pimeloyl-ACP methyl ester carboxylesterase